MSSKLIKIRNLLVENDLRLLFEFTFLRHQVVIVKEITSHCAVFALLAAFPKNFLTDLYQRNSPCIY
jgi:hypothetical protein